MDTMTRINFDLATQGLYWAARGMDLRTDKAWRALIACAEAIAERYERETGQPAEAPLDVLLMIDSEKGGKNEVTR